MQVRVRGETSQRALAEWLGISQTAVSALMRRGVLDPSMDQKAATRALFAHYREKAAGRSAESAPSPLNSERARLAREQANKLERENAEGEAGLIPVEDVADVLESVAGIYAAQLAEVPQRIARAAGLERMPAAVDEARQEVERIEQTTAGALRAFVADRRPRVDAAGAA